MWEAVRLLYHKIVHSGFNMDNREFFQGRIQSEQTWQRWEMMHSRRRLAGSNSLRGEIWS
jgi:hypothetical protein